MTARAPNCFPRTSRTEVKRAAKRALYDRAIAYGILDEALYCHVGFVDDKQPFVIPTIHVRVDDHLYIHGATASRMIRTLQTGSSACITVTLLDGLVLARSAFHHSMNYRSVVVLGSLSLVTDPSERESVFRALVDHIVAGRSQAARSPNQQESKATALMRITLTEVSAKMRIGPPQDDKDDLQLPVWAGVLPFSLRPDTPIPDPQLAPNIPCPHEIADYRR